MDNEWKRLTPGTRDGEILLFRKIRDDYVFQPGFQDEGDLRKDIYCSPVYVSEAELAQLPEVKALVEALEWYATSGHYVQSHQYRNGELVDVTSKARDDCGERARAALAPFTEDDDE